MPSTGTPASARNTTSRMTGECAANENSSAEDSRDGRGSVYYLSSGPSLFESFGDLEPLLIPVENNDEEMNFPKQATTRDENIDSSE